mmetsp:Transcript_56435/g.157305  ORF Transcript_56435/g.157305 Transcript_56435/m.157305 type:complete len:250 (+) Transcript_56435:1510-2259(+)
MGGFQLSVGALLLSAPGFAPPADADARCISARILSATRSFEMADQKTSKSTGFSRWPKNLAVRTDTSSESLWQRRRMRSPALRNALNSVLPAADDVVDKALSVLSDSDEGRRRKLRLPPGFKRATSSLQSFSMSARKARNSFEFPRCSGSCVFLRGSPAGCEGEEEPSFTSETSCESSFLAGWPLSFEPQGGAQPAGRQMQALPLRRKARGSCCNVSMTWSKQSRSSSASMMRTLVSPAAGDESFIATP